MPIKQYTAKVLPSLLCSKVQSCRAQCHCPARPWTQASTLRWSGHLSTGWTHTHTILFNWTHLFTCKQRHSFLLKITLGKMIKMSSKFNIYCMCGIWCTQRNPLSAQDFVQCNEFLLFWSIREKLQHSWMFPSAIRQSFTKLQCLPQTSIASTQVQL